MTVTDTSPSPVGFGIRTESPPGDWFAIWTRSRHEQVVREQLERKQVETFLPTITRWSRWKDRRKKIEWPLFPGYCFARFDPTSRLRILRCTGVVNIVSFDGEPAPIATHQIDSVRRLVNNDLRSGCRLQCRALSARRSRASRVGTGIRITAAALATAKSTTCAR